MSGRSVYIVASNKLLREGLKLGLRRSQLAVVGEGVNLDHAFGKDDPAWSLDMVIAVGASGNLESLALECRKMRSLHPQTKFVMVADQLTPSEVLTAMQAGVNAIVSIEAPPSVILSSLKLVMEGQQVFPLLPLDLLALRGEAGTVDFGPVAEVEVSHPRSVATALEPSNLVPFSRRPVISSVRAIAPSFAATPGAATPGAATPGGETLAGPLLLSDREEQILRCLVNGQPNKVIARELGIAETTVKVHVKSVLRKVQASNRTQAAIWAVNHRSMRPGSELRLSDVADDSQTG